MQLVFFNISLGLVPLRRHYEIKSSVGPYFHLYRYFTRVNLVHVLLKGSVKFELWRLYDQNSVAINLNSV